MRPAELIYLRGDSKKIRSILNWQPEFCFESLLNDIINHWQKTLINKNICDK